MAAHDLKDPLRLIAASLDILSERAGSRLDKEDREILAFAIDGARQMESVIRRCLDGVPGSAAASGDDALRRALQILAPLAREHGAAVTSEPLPRVAMDEGALVQTLQNLVGNAIRHAGHAPRVRVGATRERGRWRIRVADSGPGFPAGAMRGQRADGSFGLGIESARRLVEAAGGELHIENGPEGGAIVSFVVAGA